MGYSRKNPQPHNGRHGGKSYGGGGGLVLTALEIQMGGGGSEPKFTSYIQVFRNCFAFLNIIILSNYRPLTTSFF